MEKNINKFKMEELGLLTLNTACYSALVITSVIIFLTVLSSLLSKKIILADYSKQSFEVNELLKFLVFYPIGEELLLRGLILKFLKKKTGKNIWVYTGYTIEDILENRERKACLKYIDVLVDGLFIKELYSPALKFRGSSNQRIIRKSEFENYYGNGDKPE